MTRPIPLLALLVAFAFPLGATAQTVTFHSFCHAVDADTGTALVGYGHSFESPVSIEESRRLDQLRDEFDETVRTNLGIASEGDCGALIETPEERDSEIAGLIELYEQEGLTVLRWDARSATARILTYYDYWFVLDRDKEIALFSSGHSRSWPISDDEETRLSLMRDDFAEAARDLDIDYRGIASSSLNDRTPEDRDADMAMKIRGFENSGYTVFRVDEPG